MLGYFKKGSKIYKGSALLFLTVYVLVLFFSPIHSLKHNQPQEDICYEEDNLCHLRLVHHDLENGCDHDFHITDDIPVCEICALLQHQSLKDLVSWEVDTPIFEAQIGNVEIGFSPYFTIPQPNLSRGPPVIS